VNKRKVYLGYCGVLLILALLHLTDLLETDWLFNGAITLLCLGQLFSTAVVPDRERLTSSKTLEQQNVQKKPLLSWRLFFLLVIPLIGCTALLALLK